MYQYFVEIPLDPQCLGACVSQIRTCQNIYAKIRNDFMARNIYLMKRVVYKYNWFVIFLCYVENTLCSFKLKRILKVSMIDQY